MKQLEHQEQVIVFKWAGIMRRKHQELDIMYAVPNAAKRTPRQGAYMKAEGLKAGVPDIVLPIARGKYHSLYIELKVAKRKASPNQLMFLHNLEAQGNLAVVCVGADAAIRTIESYLELKPYEEMK